MTSTPIAENYHLKWDSHPLYMNLSLANLFKNEKFADVMLLTSNPDCGPGIPAHKIILTSCSSYFASIFDMNSLTTATSGIVYIVLPPELSRRAVKILVQYMYSGEATVSNDILNEVLKGGELLKIRGLCRNNNNNSGHINTTSNLSRSHSSDSNSSQQFSNRKAVDFGVNLKHTDRDKPQYNAELRNLGSSSSLSAANLPKESPVIVRSPKPPLSSSSSSQIHHQSIPSQPSAQNISIRKDVAIDPDECHSSSKYYHNHHHQSSSNNCSNFSLLNKESHLIQEHCSEAICRNYPPSIPESPLSAPDLDRIRPNSENICNSYTRREEDFSHDRHQKHSHDNESLLRSYSRRASLPENSRSILKKMRGSTFLNENSTDSNHETKLPSIKQEPNDWSVDQRSNSPKVMAKQTLLPLNVVKTESDHSGEDQNTDKENEDDMSYSPLTCDLCSETFTVPKDWVRHIEGHMDSTSTHSLPKKKRKIPQQSDSEFIATLKCDLCSTFFTTPADWVRHIQNSHTETELAMCNVEQSSNTPSSNSQQQSNAVTVKKKRSNPRSEYEMYLGKTCTICSKKFPSYASMVIHARTHHVSKHS